jgi:Tol biopolymer transport system component
MMSVLGFGRTSLFNVWLVAAATLLAACLLVLVGIEKAAEAAFPGVNGKIAFISSRDGNNEIYIMDGDGSNQTRLTNNSADDRAPAWSADGSKIAFRSSRDGNNEIYVMDGDGSNQTRLTNNPADENAPAWSPDGSKIAFASSRDGNYEIYAMDADASNVVRLTNNLDIDFTPAWSPDGSKIAFHRNRAGDFEINVMNADGSNQTNLTNNPSVDAKPAWSPDGSKIAFHSNRDGDFEIYAMNADGSNQTNLTNTPAVQDDEVLPAWSADGSKITFRITRDGNNEIYAMGSDGTNRTNLTNNPALDDFPDWGPTTADTTLPILELPEDIIVNATTADGAQVTFDVSATDNTDPNPVVNCSPVSGSAFPIGTTSVTCTATDSSGNKVSGSFSVTLKGATDQISDLKVLVTSLALPAGTTTSLQTKLNEALSAANGGDTASACTALNDFISQVRAQAGKKKLSAQDAQDLIPEAQRIQAVLGC